MMQPPLGTPTDQTNPQLGDTSPRVPLSSPMSATSYKDEFLASLSHELRTPLQAILGYATALREGEANDETLRGLAVIERNARSLTQLVERLLDLSLLRTGRVRATLERVDVAELVRESVAALEPMFSVRRISVVFESNRDTHADVDVIYLRKAIDQLLFNGFRVSQEESTLRVEVEGGDAVSLRITDESPHWTPESVATAFELFGRDQRAERSSDGLGIGLAFVKSVAELHQGEAFAELSSKPPGASLGFRILAMNHRTKLTSKPPKHSAAGLGPGCVLVVEDEEDARDLLRLILEREGLKVFVASSAQEALTHLAAERFDFMISDVGLPGMSGLELIQAIRADGLHPSLRAVALTAFAGPRDGVRAIDAGFDRFLPKPADAKSVVAVLRQLQAIDGHSVERSAD